MANHIFKLITHLITCRIDVQLPLGCKVSANGLIAVGAAVFIVHLALQPP
jgi:hypothetical protein